MRIVCFFFSLLGGPGTLGEVVSVIGQKDSKVSHLCAFLRKKYQVIINFVTNSMKM